MAQAGDTSSASFKEMVKRAGELKSAEDLVLSLIHISAPPEPKPVRLVDIIHEGFNMRGITITFENTESKPVDKSVYLSLIHIFPSMT